MRNGEVEILRGTYLGGIEPHGSQAGNVAGGQPVKPAGGNPVTAGIQIAMKIGYCMNL